MEENNTEYTLLMNKILSLQVRQQDIVSDNSSAAVMKKRLQEALDA